MHRHKLTQFTAEELKRADDWLVYNSPREDRAVNDICIILATQLGMMHEDHG